MTKKILFCHIPKTAGSTFLGVLLSRFQSERIFHVNAGSIHSAKRYYEVTNEILNGLDSRIIINSDLIYGHMPFVMNHKYETFFPITFLRDPVKRVISDYLYTRTTPKNPLYYILQNMTLREYVSQHKDLHLDNLQTRLISGKISGELNSSDLELAEDNLHHKFKFYGITEYFDHSLIMLNEVLDWQVSSYAVRNVTKARENNIVEADLAAVKEYNAMDVLLYDRAKTRFLKSIQDKGSNFEDEVKSIKKIDVSSKPSLGGNLYKKFRRLIK